MHALLIKIVLVAIFGHSVLGLMPTITALEGARSAGAALLVIQNMSQAQQIIALKLLIKESPDIYKFDRRVFVELIRLGLLRPSRPDDFSPYNHLGTGF